MISRGAILPAHVAPRLGRAVQRSVHASAVRTQAVAQEKTSFSEPTPKGESIPRGASNVANNPRSSRPSQTELGSRAFSPFAHRAESSGRLDANYDHALKWTGLDLILHRPGTAEPPIQVSQWWLRDHCPCTICMNQVTRQRQVNNLNGPSAKPRIKKANISNENGAIDVEWTDGHRSTYERDFVLLKHSPILEALRRGNTPLKLWDASIATDPPTVANEALQSGQYGELMRKIRIFGFCLIDGVAPTPEASKAVLENIGPIRETHYGGFTVVTNDLTIKDTAYTSEALEPHNDNTYFSDAAGLQMLHLLSHEKGSGGQSLFVDGFSIANQLYQEAPELYNVLATYGIHAHASGNEGINLQPCETLPVLRHDSSGKELIQVRWNNADRAGVEAPQSKMDSWYEAASKFQQLLNKESNRLWLQLKPGQPIIFDNWRLMHGRSEFTGIRTMCGGYIDHDYYISKFKTTNYSTSDLVAAVVSG